MFTLRETTHGAAAEPLKRVWGGGWRVRMAFSGLLSLLLLLCLLCSGHVTLSQSFKEAAFAPPVKETLNDPQLT